MGFPTDELFDAVLKRANQEPEFYTMLGQKFIHRVDGKVFKVKVSVEYIPKFQFEVSEN